MNKWDPELFLFFTGRLEWRKGKSMTIKQTPPSTPVGFDSVSTGEILPLRELGRRFGLGQKSLRAIQRDGLRTIQVGRLKFVLGGDILTFFERLAEEQNGGTIDA